MQLCNVENCTPKQYCHAEFQQLKRILKNQNGNKNSTYCRRKRHHRQEYDRIANKANVKIFHQFQREKFG